MAEQNGSEKKSLGQLLKETRESKGYSLRTIHEATKIPLDVLKAIEEGYSVRTLSPFYLKGFLKMYAEYLGIDPARVSDRPAAVLQKAAQPSKPKITQITPKEYSIPDDEFDFNRIFSKDQQRLAVKIIAGIFLLFLVIRMIGCLIPGKKDKTAVESVKTEVPVSPKEIAQKKLIAQPATSSQAKASGSALPESSAAKSQENTKAANEKVRLTIKALKGGWLQVKVDGAVVLESTIKAGVVETWEAEQEVVISGRTIHSLEFELNGEVIGTLGREDRNARRVVITKKGLSVKR